VARQNVVFVEITLVRGRTVEKKKALYAAVAKELGAAGVRPDDVFVVLHETERADWSFGNGEAQVLDTELLKRYGWTPPTD
jgi:phenylpyruvate tautomerase PptA (4-oxalocrotonate tautomerase family)